MRVLALIEIPIETLSTNEQKRMYWRTLAKKVKQERQAVALFLQAQLDKSIGASVTHVTLDRHGPRDLDDDNLAGSMKAVRDEVAKFLGVKDDPTSRVKFDCTQGKSPEYFIRIILEGP